MATEYLTNDTDLKAVADAIRAKTSSTDALVFPDGFVNAINGIQSDRFRQWTYVSDGQNTENPLYLVRGDAWLKEHRTDENLVIVLMPKFTALPGSNIMSVIYSINTNRNLANLYGRDVYGGYARFTTDSGGGNPYFDYGSVGGGSGAEIGEIRILSNGDLYVVAFITVNGLSFALQAGEWTITAFLV